MKYAFQFMGSYSSLTMRFFFQKIGKISTSASYKLGAWCTVMNKYNIRLTVFINLPFYIFHAKNAKLIRFLHLPLNEYRDLLTYLLTPWCRTLFEKL